MNKKKLNVTVIEYRGKKITVKGKWLSDLAKLSQDLNIKDSVQYIKKNR